MAKIPINRDRNKTKKEREAAKILEEVTTSKLVAEIDERIHKACKIQATIEGTTIKQIVEISLTKYLKSKGVDINSY